MAVNDRGRQGEEAAALYLQKQGMRILAQNYRVRGGELDIVAQEGDTVVFVEVKARGGEGFGPPCLAVNARKQALLRRTAERWLYDNQWEAYCRFDVIELVYDREDAPVLRHWKNAF